MEQTNKTWLTTQLKKLFLENVTNGGLLEIRKFGRTDLPSVWVELESLQSAGESLKQDAELKLDWLENMSVVEFEDVFVVNYFLRSFSTPHQLVLRVSAVTKYKPETLPDNRFPDNISGNMSGNKSGNQTPSQRSHQKPKQGLLEVPSVKRIWPMAGPLENEAAEMFGIWFKLSENEKERTGSFRSRILPEGWLGFPLRKDYQFPAESEGLAHEVSGSGGSI